MKLKAILSTAVSMVLLMPVSAKAEGVLEGWKGSVFAGYNQAQGNTNKSAASLQLEANKKVDGVAYLLKGSMAYSETNNAMDGQKWDALGRMSFDFGADQKWYSLYQVLLDHDYFSDIDYRLTPSAGIGYHIAASDDWTWDADAGLGYRVERHRMNKEANDEYLTALVHTFMKKQVFEKAYLSEDITVYPGLKTGSAVNVRAETTFTNPLSQALDFELKYIVDHNSQPAADKKKTDTQVIAGVKYKF
jgi:putative salt-induced outer membrane protein YdiY